ncbi:MAG: hypothetical protein WCD76_02965 [Pyrinomonadaceae bacterium]
MLDIWDKLPDEVSETYARALHRPDLPAAQREEEARSFLAWAERFQRGGAQARMMLRRVLDETDDERRNTAARLLLEMPDAEAVATVVAALSDSRQLLLSDSNLRRLVQRTPQHDVLWTRLNALSSNGRAALLHSLLRRPTRESRAYIDEALASGANSLSQEAIEAVAAWGEPEILRRMMESAPPSTEMPPWLREDARLDAAFYLALTGDRRGIEFLERFAAGEETTLAARAALFLAWLARPEAVGVIEGLLRNTDPHVAGVALDAASALHAAALCPALLHLAAQSSASQTDPPPLADDAVKVLLKLTGAQLPEGRIEYVDSSLEELTPPSRQIAVTFLQTATRKLNPALRYVEGELLTLAHLAARLSSPHSGEMRAAAYNLRAITGEDYGFDPAADLIANLPAIVAWRERAARDSPMPPGKWAFAGMPLSSDGIS